ncbi:MAG: lysozyme [Reyranella sp.]|jgi:lysozyme|nr:lysozyme [Reyranella sp.]
MSRPSSPRATGEAGISLIRAFEGFSAVPYICPAGVLTVGYGHVVADGERFDAPLSAEEGEALLRADLPRYERAVCRLIEMPLSDPCFDSLASFTFNLGEGALAASTLRRLVNAGRLAEAGPQFDRWVFAGARKLAGLVRRRAAERALWERGVADNS